MQYPLMNASRSYRVSVPELKGGINQYDSPAYIDDNQVTMCRNLWWINGALRTRPGLVMKSLDTQLKYDKHDFSETDVLRSGFNINTPYYGQYDMRVYDYNLDPIAYINFIRYDGTMEISENGTYLNSGRYGTANLIYTNGSININGKRSEMLVFTSLGRIFSSYRNGEETLLEEITGKAYAPLVMVNGEPVDNQSSPVGTLFEGYNMLTGAFRCWFTSIGQRVTYKLPTDKLTDNSGEDILIEYLDNGGLTHTWTIPYDSSKSSSYQQIGQEQLYAHVNRENGTIYFMGGTNILPLPESETRNNVKITAWKTDSDKNELICDMTISTWFGGDRSSTNGGTRLFLSGNRFHPGLVHWSDINNPLYFPENNYAYIGDKSSQVTAFGKQQNVLVIFKEHEMFYAEYVAGTPYTAEDVIEGRVVDVTSYAATFPITPINGYIGCDCPKTVRLCNNHLVWATSDGHVYTLASPNQYNQRNVQAVSQMIEPLLKDISFDEWEAAHAVDYRGHYLLQVAGKAFLFNYGDSGFLYSNSYYKQETAQRNIAWYMWDIAVEGVKWIYAMAREDQIVFLGYAGDNFVSYILDDKADFDEMNPQVDGSEILTDKQKIPYLFQTKQFDFGAMERRKTIGSVYIRSGESTESQVTYILEKGEITDVRSLVPVMGVSRKTPNISRERTFGMRLEGTGHAEFAGITIQYKLIGGVR